MAEADLRFNFVRFVTWGLEQVDFQSLSHALLSDLDFAQKEIEDSTR